MRQQRLRRVAELAKSAPELSDTTRAMILAQVDELLQAAGKPKRTRPAGARSGARVDRGPDPAGGRPAAAAERLDQLEKDLAVTHRACSAIARLSRNAGRYLRHRGEA